MENKSMDAPYMLCPNCGDKHPLGTIYCPKCGTPTVERNVKSPTPDVEMQIEYRRIYQQKNEFKFLRGFSSFIETIGWIMLALSIVLPALVLWTGRAAIAQKPDTFGYVSPPLSSVTAGANLIAIMIFVPAFLGGVSLIANGQLLKLVIDMRDHTVEMAGVIRGLAKLITAKE
jgi:hypothetical protein